MALNKHPDELADARGDPSVRDELRAIRERCDRYPVLDHRTANEILDYDDHGLPR
jgi:hypothetical protein